jgi:hypothetical protein
VSTNNHPRGLHDPLTLIFAPILIVVGLLFPTLGGEATLRVMGLLFLVSGGLWLVNAWRGFV